MLVASWSEAIGEAEEVHLVDRVEHPDRRPAGRSCPPARRSPAAASDRRLSGCTRVARALPGTLRDELVHADPRGDSSRSCPYSLPCHTVDPGSGLSLGARGTLAEPLEVTWCRSAVNFVFLSLSCCFAHTFQRTGRAGPALCPGRVLLVRVPLGRPLPSTASSAGTARLCSATSSVLRARLTSPGRASSAYGLGLPDATRARHRRRADLAISRFSRRECFRTCSGSSTAQGRRISRFRDAPCCLPLRITASAPWSV